MPDKAKKSAVSPPTARWEPAPYRYMPDRQVEGQPAIGTAESWAPSTSATLIHRGPFVFDQGALLGLDETARRGVIEYVGVVADRLAAIAQPPSFDQWVLKEGHRGSERCGGSGSIPQWFPSNFDVNKAGTAPVPIKLLPSPDAVRSALGPRLADARTDTIEDLAAAGFKVGRTAVYEHGALRPNFVEGMTNGARLFRLLPLATPAVAPTITAVVQMKYAPQYGRLVIPNTVEAWREIEHAFKRDGNAGSRYFGEVQTVELIPEVCLRRVFDAKGHASGSPTIVYELWDGLEGVRCDAPAGNDPLAVRVTMTAADGTGDAKLGGQELFRMPLPLSRAGSGSLATEYPQERIAIDDSWSAANPPFVAVRKGQGWEAYCESLVIDADRKSVKARDGSLLLLGIFSNITPDQLVDIMTDFVGADPAPIRADKEFMGKLQGLAERVNPNR